MKDKKIIENAVVSLLEMFRTGEMPEAVAKTMIRRKAGDDQPSFHWSLGNQILMVAQGTIDARGYAQWKQVGRHVKKGAKAIHILAPLTRTVKKIDEATGEETKKSFLHGFRSIPVFRYEDTEGEELERPDYTPLELPPMWEVAWRMGLRVEYMPGTGSAWGSYSPSAQEIRLHTHDWKTFYHELAHHVHGTIKPLKPGQHPEQEIVAETVAAVLLQLQGVSGFEYHSYNYICSYVENNGDVDVIKNVMKLLGEIEQVLEIIFLESKKAA